MARKRMFDTEIITQDSFLDLPLEAKALYFLLGMEADDEGFVSPKKVLRLYGGTEDSIRLLAVKNFIIPFQSGVIVITDWNTNNYLDKTRIKETIYLDEKSQLCIDSKTKKYILAESSDTKCLTNVKQMLNQNRIEEYSIDNNNMSNETLDECLSEEEKLSANFNLIWEDYPRKEGKLDAYKHYKALIKWKKVFGKTMKFTNDEILNAVISYAKENQYTDKKYIAQGSTFFNSKIIDYLLKAKEEQNEQI